ncbi:MAG TPA: hypothetical protein VMX13_09890 [Sedimentisphaerales bacterium]|nr:hypothetical protein [Sedimentisphaerales bacterium]
MNAQNLAKRLVVGIALVCVFAGYVWADKLQLQTGLGKDIKIQLRDVTIAEALEKIGQEAGVKFVLSDEAAWKLPQGEATRLSVMMQGPLAESMTEMLNAFFMRYAVGDEEVTIHPRPELEHILGRPSAKQLELLKAIYTRPIKHYSLDRVQVTINKALGHEIFISPIHVQAQLNDLLRQLVGKDKVYAWKFEQGGRRSPRGGWIKQLVKGTPEQEPNEPEPSEYDLPTPVTLVQLLSQVELEGDSRNTRWYISGMDFLGQNPEIRVLDHSTFGQLKLNQKIDISYKDAPLDKILRDLAGRAGVRLIVSPGSYLSEHELSATMQNVTIEQAVRSITDMVGASCKIDGSSIELVGPGKPKIGTPPVRTGSSEPKGDSEGYVGKISIPMDGGKYYIEFMLREKDLTDELKKLWQEKMKQILKVPGFHERAPAAEPQPTDKTQEMQEER